MEIAANQKNYRMKQSGRQASMQVLNPSVARPWKLEQNTSGQASRQALRASRLWKLEQNNMKKKGPFFGPQNVRKSRRAKMGLPSNSSRAPHCPIELFLGCVFVWVWFRLCFWFLLCSMFFVWLLCVLVFVFCLRQ